MDELKAQVSGLLDQAFALGVASVSVGGISQEQLGSAVAAAKQSIKDGAKAAIDSEDAELKSKIDALP